MRLAELARNLGGVLVPEEGLGPRISGVQLDSRRVEPGDLFCALPGSRADGARFAADALARGAAAVLSERPLDLPGPAAQWLHPDARRAAALAARQVHGAPASSMFVAGVTGTNGKTTTAHLIAHLLDRSGRRSALFGTAGNRLAGGRTVGATHTTPDAPELQRLFAAHRTLGGDSVAMEVSSHALDQERTAGVDFDVAVFTNLTRDHLDYHGDMEAYAHAKERLFAGLRPNAWAVVNADDPAAERMAAAARARGAGVITYSAREGGDLGASEIRTDLRGTHLFLQGMGISRTRLWLPLVGRFNVENALAAAACALLSGASSSSILEGLAAAPGAPGRLERVPTNGREFELYVDYAHSPDALDNVCRTLRASLAGGRLLVVFGAGGDRDRGKRAPMGCAVNQLADVAFVTSDNPRSEDPLAIVDDVVRGMHPPRARRVVEPDRRRAIELACAEARAGDVVLIAGKGHEGTQDVGGVKLPFDDRAVAREVLA